MPAPLTNDAQLSKSGRWRLRQNNEAAMVRNTGPTMKPLSVLSASGQLHRIRNRANVEVILWGAGMPRCGTTCLARNCHDAGGRQNIKQTLAKIDEYQVRYPNSIDFKIVFHFRNGKHDNFRNSADFDPTPNRRIELVSVRRQAVEFRDSRRCRVSFASRMEE